MSEIPVTKYSPAQTSERSLLRCSYPETPIHDVVHLLGYQPPYSQKSNELLQSICEKRDTKYDAEADIDQYIQFCVDSYDTLVLSPEFIYDPNRDEKIVAQGLSLHIANVLRQIGRHSSSLSELHWLIEDIVHSNDQSLLSYVLSFEADTSIDGAIAQNNRDRVLTTDTSAA